MKETPMKTPALLTKEEVAEKMRLSASQIDRLRDDEDRNFPEGVPVYGRKLVWRADEVEAWVNALFAKREKKHAAAA